MDRSDSSLHTELLIWLWSIAAKEEEPRQSIKTGLQDSFRSLASSFGTLCLRMRYGTVGLIFDAGSSAA